MSGINTARGGSSDVKHLWAGLWRNKSDIRSVLGELRRNPLVRMAAKRHWLGRILLFVLDHPGLAGGLLGVGLGMAMVVPASVLIFILSMQGANMTQSVAAEGLPTAVTPGVIPATYLPDLEAAALKWRVPLQFLAGEAETESRFNPQAKNYNPGTHAGGMFQFEPSTWNGSSDPMSALDTFDTDRQSIAKYGGYGVDANQDGTADPFDPADAAMGAAHYLRTLYEGYHHSWNLASYWYGSETQAYVTTVLGDMAGFVAQTPAEKVGGGYWFVGGKKDTLVTAETGNTLTISTPTWDPIYAPMDGNLTVTYKASSDTLQWTDGTGATTLTFTGGIVAFANTGSSVSAGQLIGFTTTKNLVIQGSENPISVVGGKLPSWVTG